MPLRAAAGQGAFANAQLVGRHLGDGLVEPDAAERSGGTKFATLTATPTTGTSIGAFITY
jgi:hypothetical protein